MDKNAIKKYAVWARRELITRVSQRAAYYEITEENTGDPAADTALERPLTPEEKIQRRALIENIRAKGYREVTEEIAYTWFNRFIALRFMEVNGYLPSHVRVFTDDANAFKPQILTEAINLELDGLDMKKVYAYKQANDDDGLFKYLVIVQCNALSAVMPGMFQPISNYTELLFPDNLLREGSVIQQMIEKIPEADWQDAVQIIGWLYQYYNSEKKDEVFAALKKNVKITKENIPAATQLFTPDWIVRYMVENSLGRLWVEGHPNDGLKAGWKYYLEEAPQEPAVEDQLAAIRKEHAALTPDQIKCIDPCAGSGHILVYLFDVLMQIYESYGYTTREAVASIIENNLYGLDIDDRAAQLAYFAVMMKARQYDRRFLARRDENGDPAVPQPHVYPIRESGGVDPNALAYFTNGDPALALAVNSILNDLQDAKEYGSILQIHPVDFAALDARFDQLRQEDPHMERNAALSELLPLVQVAKVLAQKYDVVVTNPPYMGSNNMGTVLSSFVKANYPDSKADLSTVFMELCQRICKQNGMYAMINIPVWMTQSSFFSLRRNLLSNSTFINMLHLGRGVFGSDFGTTAFVIRHGLEKSYNATYRRLFEGLTQVDSLEVKEKWFFEGKGSYQAKQCLYEKIDGLPIAYWVTKGQVCAFEFPALSTLAEPRQGFATGDNERFLRFWQEVDYTHASFGCKNRDEAKRSGSRWFPCNKGGAFRRWYGNNDRFVNWENDGAEMVAFSGSVIRNPAYYFRQGMTWSTATMSKLSMRFSPVGFLFESKGSVCFPIDNRNLNYLLALLNTKIVEKLLLVLAPTVDYHEGPLGRVPVIISKEYFTHVSQLSDECVNLAKMDWDSFETSWDFKPHPLVKLRLAGAYAWGDGQPAACLASAYHAWKLECEGRFQKLKANEEELNRIFIDIYGLQDELTPEEEDKDVTVHTIVDTREEIPASQQGSNYVLTRRDVAVSLISYAVGCMFGRYSLDVEGLVYAGGDFNTKYCRWVRKFGDKATEEIDEKGQLVGGGWAGCTLWEYDGVRKDGKWIAASYPPDTDNIIPICDDEYFEDDLTGRFVKFIETVYGKETLEENLRFIADALGGKGQPRSVIRSYFLNDFYADHCRTYQKRPIYWLFDSGKKNGFKALIYMHRYAPDTIARIRTDYVHEQQSRYHTAIADLETRAAAASAGERVKLGKQLKKLKDQDDELRLYEEKIHHLADQMLSIDLDDGVKHNYAIFQDVLAKIR